ncbi:MAG TPA: hypothetical protein VMW48_15895 [Vicinamibacterales bacterium]|nr:hypothetical protein [Vicinamibacterales bacterium]
MKTLGIIGIVALLAGCSSSNTSTPPAASSQTPSTAPAATAAADGTPAELKSLIGARGSSGEQGLAQAGYEFRNASKTDASSITHWRGKSGTCVAVTTTEGRYASITSVDAGKCADDGSAVTPSGKAGATRTVCGVIVGGTTNLYLCEVEENRQGTTVLRFPDTTLKLTWNVGSTSVQVEQEGTAPVTVKYADAEGETNFRLDQRTFFYISNPGLAEMEVKNFRK